MRVGVRLAVPDDVRFVAASWFESYWKATRRLEGVPFEAYQRGQDAIIRRLLEVSDTTVAFAEVAPDEILGYSVIQGRALHYVYVKAAYRKMGVATGLVKGRADTFTHSTRAGERIAKAFGFTFDPYGVMP